MNQVLADCGGLIETPQAHDSLPPLDQNLDQQDLFQVTFNKKDQRKNAAALHSCSEYDWKEEESEDMYLQNTRRQSQGAYTTQHNRQGSNESEINGLQARRDSLHVPKTQKRNLSSGEGDHLPAQKGNTPINESHKAMHSKKHQRVGKQLQNQSETFRATSPSQVLVRLLERKSRDSSVDLDQIGADSSRKLLHIPGEQHRLSVNVGLARNRNQIQMSCSQAMQESKFPQNSIHERHGSINSSNERKRRVKKIKLKKENPKKDITLLIEALEPTEAIDDSKINGSLKNIINFNKNMTPGENEKGQDVKEIANIKCQETSGYQHQTTGATSQGTLNVNPFGPNSPSPLITPTSGLGLSKGAGMSLLGQLLLSKKQSESKRIANQSALFATDEEPNDQEFPQTDIKLLKTRSPTTKDDYLKDKKELAFGRDNSDEFGSSYKFDESNIKDNRSCSSEQDKNREHSLR
ncbi:hypothetical protein FGO68_gene1057 [Halteria grandinella]|uniref:Uncharacterized protein n=1 Tax=Halteria grandinella TaxID=5974 RepID=A0A8J8P3X6_HALGN|nr:hypothetical protein FGO68_gene1057 [Halteria grandinella]